MIENGTTWIYIYTSKVKHLQLHLHLNVDARFYTCTKGVFKTMYTHNNGIFIDLMFVYPTYHHLVIRCFFFQFCEVGGLGKLWQPICLNDLKIFFIKMWHLWHNCLRKKKTFLLMTFCGWCNEKSHQKKIASCNPI
jgi:hypothetical protein